MTKLYAIDTNVFIYVLGGERDLHPASLKLLKSIEAGEARGVASELVRLELLSNGALTISQIEKIQHFLLVCGVKFLPISTLIIEEAARLRRSNPKLKTPDAIHLATASLNSAEVFVTNDQELFKLKEIDGVQITSVL